MPAKAGIQGPRAGPKNWVPASAGTSGIQVEPQSIASTPFDLKILRMRVE